MNFFCRIFGHTWVPQSENPKIRWTNAKNLSELEMTVTGEPQLYLACARCKERKPFDRPALTTTK
jgi:uncharacterized metal-binding protein YceD (DUF177 family)